MREEYEEQRDRRLWDIGLRVLWTSLIVLLVAGVLCGLTFALAWWRYVLLCAVGLLAGLSVSIAVAGSARGRELTALVLGAVTLPALAAHVAGIAARDGIALDAYSAALVPFLVHASGAVLGGVAIAGVWKRRPPAPPADGAEEQAPRAIAAAPPPGAPVRVGEEAFGEERAGARSARRSTS